MTLVPYVHKHGISARWFDPEPEALAAEPPTPKSRAVIVRRRKWSNDQIIDLIRAWADEHGDPPSARDFWRLDDYPSHNVVIRRFGSWSNGIRAAGLDPRSRGQRK